MANQTGRGREVKEGFVTAERKKLILSYRRFSFEPNMIFNYINYYVLNILNINKTF